MTDHDSFQALWDSGAPLWGGWCSIASATTAEIVGRAGYDWVGIDFQHGAMSHADVDAMVRSLWLARVPAFVRVPSAQSVADICKALDFGAAGVIVPVVNTAEEARMAASACRYEPLGQRSWAGPLVRAMMADASCTPQVANRRVKCIVMIETMQAVENIEAIVAVPGVDAIFVGPSDLAHSAGLEPSLFAADAEHVRRIEHVFAAAARRGVVAGIYAGTVQAAQGWIARGARFVALTDDSTLLRMAAAAMVQQMRRVAAPTEMLP